MKHPARIIWEYGGFKSIQHARARAAKIKVIQKNLHNKDFVKAVTWALSPDVKFKRYWFPVVATCERVWVPATQLNYMFAVLNNCSQFPLKIKDKGYRTFAAHSDPDTIRLFHAIYNKNLQCGAGLFTFRKAGVEI